MSRNSPLSEQLRSTFDRSAVDTAAYEPKPQPAAPALIAKPSAEFVPGEIPTADEAGAADTVPVESNIANTEPESTQDAPVTAEPLDQTLEAHRRALLGDLYQAPNTSVPRQITYEDVLADVRREMAQGQQRPGAPKKMTMEEFAAAELAKKIARKAAITAERERTLPQRRSAQRQ